MKWLVGANDHPARPLSAHSVECHYPHADHSCKTCDDHHSQVVPPVSPVEQTVWSVFPQIFRYQAGYLVITVILVHLGIYVFCWINFQMCKLSLWTYSLLESLCHTENMVLARVLINLQKTPKTTYSQCLKSYLKPCIQRGEGGPSNPKSSFLSILEIIKMFFLN